MTTLLPTEGNSHPFIRSIIARMKALGARQTESPWILSLKDIEVSDSQKDEFEEVAQILKRHGFGLDLVYQDESTEGRLFYDAMSFVRRSQHELIMEKNFLKLVSFLRGKGAKSFRLEFNGGGDDGAIESIVFDGVDEGLQIELLDLADRPLESANGLEFTEQRKTVTIAKALETCADYLLDKTDVDWYNNEGGFGSFEYNFEEDQGAFTIDTRYVEYETQVYKEFNLELEGGDDKEFDLFKEGAYR